MDRIKEKIGYYKVLIPLLWTGMFIFGSGITWLINNSFPFKAVFFVSGVIFEVVFGITLMILNKRIKKLIKDL